MGDYLIDVEYVQLAVHTHGIDHARYLAFSHAIGYHNPPAVHHMLSIEADRELKRTGKQG